MTSRDDPKATPFKRATFANVSGLAHLSRSTSTTSAYQSRPAPQRTVSGSADTAHFSGFAAMSSPLSTPSELTHEDPLTAAMAPTAVTTKRAMSGSPSVFGVANLPHSGTWSDSSGQTASAASSVWNGRSGLATGSTDGDAIGTATTSTVSTPGRATAMAPGELGGGSSFSRSPLGTGDAGAWPAIQGAHSPLAWPKGIDSPSTGYVAMDPSTSPTAAKRRSPAGERRRQSIVHAAAVSTHPSAGVASLAESGKIQSEHLRGLDPGSNTANAAENGIKAGQSRARAGRALPRQAPVRSTTLDPSHHLPGQRRYSAEDDDEGEVGTSGDRNSNKVGDGSTDAELSGGIRAMALTETDQSSVELPLQAPPGVLSPVNTNIPPQLSSQRMQQHPQAPYHSPPQLGHAQQLSASLGTFSPGPGEGIPPSGPYYGLANRSPDTYGAYPGFGQLMPGTNGVPAIDMSGYESYRTTPDPYAPPAPGRPVFMSPGGPGSQGSTPQSPSFGPSAMPHALAPAPLRPNEAMFFPGPSGPYGAPTFGPAPMGSAALSPGAPQYGYTSAPNARGVPLSPSMGAAGIGFSSIGMPLPGQLIYPPPSPLLQGELPSGGLDPRSSQGQGHQYVAGLHRRMGSNADGYGTNPVMHVRPPYPAGGFPAPGPMTGVQLNYPGATMSGPAAGWNGRFPDHRRVPTGPGGVMSPPMGFNGPIPPYGAPMGGSVRPPGMHGPGGGFYSGRSGPSGGAMPMSSSARSPLLEEFRSRHARNRKFELRDILGSVVEFSGDQHGSRFIQEKLDQASDEDKAKVFEELVPSARQLMTDVFGNYVIQKMLEHGSDVQRSTLAKEMEGHVLPLSLGTYGCRVVQKAFDHTGENQRVALAKELDGHILQCVKDQNANHVVQKIIETVEPSKIDFVAHAFQGQVLSLAAHCYSCRVLQRIFEHCREDQSRPLLDELHTEAFRLMQDQYGNYVIQWVLQKGQPSDQAEVISKIKGQVLPLSRHKFASNVIEEVIRSASPQDKVELIEEILTPRPVPDTAASVVQPIEPAVASGQTSGPQQRVAAAVIMMKDQYANYVLQRFLENAKGEQKVRLVTAIRPQLQSMKRFSNGYAKHLAAIERLLDETDGAADAKVGLSTSGSGSIPATSSTEVAA